MNEMTEERPLTFSENKKYQRKILRYMIHKLHQVTAMAERIDSISRSFFINENYGH
jgi:hypothetical protein